MKKGGAEGKGKRRRKRRRREREEENPHIAVNEPQRLRSGQIDFKSVVII